MLIKLRTLVKYINDSKFLVGVSLLLINVGSKYVEMGLTKSQEHALRNGLGRELLIFSTMFMGTHDIIISILMTAAFTILSEHIFNEHSDYCIIPHKLKHMCAVAEKQGELIITAKQENDALNLLRKADEQKTVINQGKFNGFLMSNKI